MMEEKRVVVADGIREWAVARRGRALRTLWDIPGGSLAAMWTGSGRDGRALGKPVRIPREEPIIPGYRQPAQIHQRPLHTGHVLSWEEGGVVVASAGLGS